ncbi:MAG: NAD(P)/FAD-dependent oxidoreductase [Clostridiales bacterium]|uniref:NAD(P)/FAD-dependent oxidoreductase n=1 Tax=Clostridium sp. N3C TaxID=1776758 RepID=UPI00092E019C|nr:FAD-dependent oxidoreductase [Clostridium sp. N3C]NLZ49435.1 NAD(P)/FAD-dependent oxidoreductase [Clostridiales bacterium]SCN25171.1 Nitrite reductase [NAD(P)H] [Clostridium sp. N3C]
MAERIIIVGGGVAAVSAIKSIREINEKAEIYLFGSERFYPYYRLRLTKGLFDNTVEDKILLRKIDWYVENNVNIHMGKAVSSIDTDKKEITLEDGSKFNFDKLLLASGSHNFKPPIKGIDKTGVYTIRKLDDVEKLNAYIKEKKTILNIGGGIQGLETAWILHQNGKEVIIAEAMPRIMPRQLDERASSILQKAIEKLGIKLLINKQVKSIEGNDKVEGFTLDSGEYFPCDTVIYSVGVRANIDFFKNSSIKTNMGAVVNEYMETSEKGIYAAGDVAEFNGRLGGIWTVAVEQGTVAGYNIAGKETKYTGVTPSTMLNAFNISLFSIGNVDENNCTNSMIEDKEDDINYKRLFIKDNKIVGAIVLGDTKKAVAIKSAVEKEKDISQFDLDNMSIDELIDKIK